MNYKIFIIIVAYLCATQNSIAQFIISGAVKDFKTNEALSGVSIYMNDHKSGVITDSNGHFQVTNIKKGIHLLEISSLGYKSKIERIKINQDTIINIALNEAVAELNDVVVTAVSRSTELKRSPVIMKLIDKNYLNQNNANNLIDALKNIPGISQITTGAAISKPIIRGLGYNRVITLHNSIRQEGQQWGDEHGVEIDEYSINKIEIVKGPGSLMYGSDGIAGVINFISPKAPSLGQIKTQFISNYQSNNNLIAYSLSNAGNKNGLQWLGRFTNKFAGNYKNHIDGKVHNSGFQEYDGSLFLGINKKWGHTHLQLSSFNNTLNLVEGDRDSTGTFIFTTANGDEARVNDENLKGYKIGYPHQKVNHSRIVSNNYFILNKGTLNIDIGFQNNKRKEFGNATQPDDIDLFFDLNTFNYNIRYNIMEQKSWETSFGISGMQQKNLNKGLEFLIPEYRLFDAGIFILTQKAFNRKISIAGGLRFDNRNINSDMLILDSLGMPTSLHDTSTTLKFNSFKQNYQGLSGSIGLSYLVNKISTLKFNVSRGFRAPNISELASNGRHEGTFRYEIGTTNLKSEVSHQIDLAYFINSEHLTFELSPFANFISNYIFSEKLLDSNGNDVIIDPDDPAPAYKFTQGNANLSGVEVYIDLHPHPLDWLHIENSFSYVRATQKNQTDSTKYLPFIPAPKYRAELKAEFKKIGTRISNSYIKFGMDYFFAQNKFYSAYQTETRTPSYTLLGAGAGMNIKACNKKDFMCLYFHVENLTNRSYQSHLSRLKYAPENIATGRIGVSNMGRNVSLKLIFNF